MIISKASLEVRRIAALDREVYVQFEPSGRTVAMNKKSAVVVGRVPAEVQKSIPLPKTELDRPVTMGLEHLTQVAKAIGKDTVFGGLLENASVTFDKGGDEVVFTVTDGKHEKTIRGRDVGRRFDTKAILDSMREQLGWAEAAEAVHGAEGGGERIFAINRKRLMVLLDVVDKAFPDTSGESPVWLVTGRDNILLLGFDYRTGQPMGGMMKVYKGEGVAVPVECRALFAEEASKKKPITKVRRTV